MVAEAWWAKTAKTRVATKHASFIPAVVLGWKSKHAAKISDSLHVQRKRAGGRSVIQFSLPSFQSHWTHVWAPISQCFIDVVLVLIRSSVLNELYKEDNLKI